MFTVKGVMEMIGLASCHSGQSPIKEEIQYTDWRIFGIIRESYSEKELDAVTEPLVI